MKRLIILLMILTCSLFGQWFITPTNLPYYIKTLEYEKFNIDSLIIEDATGADSLVIHDDGDTTKFTSDNPFYFNNDLKINGDLTVSGAEGPHADMYFNNNTGTQTPIANDTLGITQFTQGILNGFTFDAGSAGTYTAVADGGGGLIELLAVAHGLSAGDWVFLNDGTYNGVYEVQTAVTDTFTVTATFGATDAGSWQEPSRLTLTKVGFSNATFELGWNISASVAGSPAGDDIIWGCYVNDSLYVKTQQRRTLTTGSVFGSFGSGGLIDMSTGDDIFMFFESDDVNALNNYNGSLRVGQQ